MENLPGIPSDFPARSETSPAASEPARTPIEQRMRSLGMVALVLGILELVASGWSILSMLVLGPLFRLDGRLLAMTPHPDTRLLDETARMLEQTGRWTALQVFPYMVLSAVLIGIASKLRAGQPAALVAARRWSLFALGAVAFSTAISYGLVVPVTLAYHQAAVALQPGGAAPILEKINGATGAMMWIGPISHSVFMATWPIVLRVLAGRIQRGAAR